MYACLLLVLLAATSAAAQTSLTFTALGPLPDGGRYGMGYAQEPSAFYMVGGGSPASAFNANVYVYAPGIGWVPGGASSSLPPQRWANMVIASNGSGQPLLYVLNGATAMGALVSNMQTVSVNSGNSGPTYTNPVPASSAAATVRNNIIYVYGGQLANGSYTNQLRSYNAATDTWAALAPMPEAKAALGGAVVNGKIYAIGGFNGVINSARVDAYDPATNIWQALAPLPTTVSNQAVAVQGEWIWMVGDFTNQNYLAAYNTRTGQLRTFTSNLPPRRNAAAAVLSNRLYVWGGNTASSNASTLVDMWSVDVTTVLGTYAATATALGLRATPNPSADGLVTLDLPVGTRTVEVFDALGRQVLSVAPAAAATALPLDLRQQPGGMYLVRVRTANGQSASCRVVRE